MNNYNENRNAYPFVRTQIQNHYKLLFLTVLFFWIDLQANVFVSHFFSVHVLLYINILFEPMLSIEWQHIYWIYIYIWAESASCCSLSICRCTEFLNVFYLSTVPLNCVDIWVIGCLKQLGWVRKNRSIPLIRRLNKIVSICSTQINEA